MAVPFLQPRTYVWLTPRIRSQLPFHPTLGNAPAGSPELGNFCGNLEREGRRLVGTDIREPTWFQDFTRNGLACRRSTKLYHDTETWYTKTSQHASTDILWDQFEGGLLHDYWLNTYDFTPEIYDCQLICSWPVYVPPPPVSEHNAPDPRESDELTKVETSDKPSNRDSNTQDGTTAGPSSPNSHTQLGTPAESLSPNSHAQLGTPAESLSPNSHAQLGTPAESSSRNSNTQLGTPAESSSRNSNTQLGTPLTPESGLGSSGPDLTLKDFSRSSTKTPEGSGSASRATEAPASRAKDVRAPKPVTETIEPIPDTPEPIPDTPEPAPDMLQPGFTLQSKSPPSACNAPRETVANDEIVYEIGYENLKKTSVVKPFRNRVFPVLVLTKSNFKAEGQHDPDKSFLIVQIPLDLHDVPAAHYSNSGHKSLAVADKEQKKSVVIGKYASVEHCYLRSGVPHLTHWRKALAMDIDGHSKGSDHSVLRQVVPRLLCENVDSFIQWNQQGIRSNRPVRPTLADEVPTTEDKNPSPRAEELRRGMKRNSDGTIQPDDRSKLRKLTSRCQVL